MTILNFFVGRFVRFCCKDSSLLVVSFSAIICDSIVIFHLSFFVVLLIFKIYFKNSYLILHFLWLMPRRIKIISEVKSRRRLDFDT